MAKVYGIISDYATVRQDASRTIVGFEPIPLNDGTHYVWSEIYFYKSQYPKPSIEQIKEAVISDINAQVTSEIVSGFYYKENLVWLSNENQMNYKTAYDIAVQTNGRNLPYTIKAGEEDSPAYMTFETLEEFAEFFFSMTNYIRDCIEKGWQRKDSIDWSEYNIINAILTELN